MESKIKIFCWKLPAVQKRVIETTLEIILLSWQMNQPSEDSSTDPSHNKCCECTGSTLHCPRGNSNIQAPACSQMRTMRSLQSPAGLPGLLLLPSLPWLQTCSWICWLWREADVLLSPPWLGDTISVAQTRAASALQTQDGLWWSCEIYNCADRRGSLLLLWWISDYFSEMCWYFTTVSFCGTTNKAYRLTAVAFVCTKRTAKRWVTILGNSFSSACYSLERQAQPSPHRNNLLLLLSCLVWSQKTGFYLQKIPKICKKNCPKE